MKTDPSVASRDLFFVKPQFQPVRQGYAKCLCPVRCKASLQLDLAQSKSHATPKHEFCMVFLCVCGQSCAYDVGFIFLEIVVRGQTGWVGGPFFSVSASCFLRSERPSFWEKTFVKPLDRLDLVHTLSFDDIMQDPHWTNEARNAMRTRTSNRFHWNVFFSTLVTPSEGGLIQKRTSRFG